MGHQIFAVSGIAFLALAGLIGSNFAYDRGVPSNVSRFVAPVLGGAAFLVAVLWLDAWTAITVSGVLTLSILVLRLGFRRGLRGVRGSLPTQDWAEITYPMAGTLSLAVGWGLLGDKWLAFLPIAFMAWGDSAAGLARATVWRGNVASVWPSFGMLGISLIAASLYQPYWIGVLGAVAATVAERRRPMILTIWDDNLHVVGMSLAVMGVLTGMWNPGL